MVLVDIKFVELLSIIGRGPNTPGKVGGAVMVVLGIIFVALSVGPQTRVGGAFTHGKGETVPINPTGRVILFAAALVLMFLGLRDFFH
jgi:hypothetical protein